MENKKSLLQPATKGDIKKLRAETKTDVAGLKKDVAGLKKDVAELRQDNANLREETKNEFAKLRGEIAGFRNEMFNHLDGLAKLIKGQMEEFQIHKITHQGGEEQLDDHEKRISSLEQGEL